MRTLRIAAAGLMILALSGCISAQAYEGAIESELRDLPAVEEVEISSFDSRIGAQGGIVVDVVLRAGSEPDAIGDVVDAWFASIPGGLSNSLGLELASNPDNRMQLFLGVGHKQTKFRVAAIEWATLASLYPQVAASISGDRSGITIVQPKAEAPGAVREVVEGLRSAIVGVDTGADWMITSVADQYADQGLDVLSRRGLPSEEDLQHLESMGSAFTSAMELGDIHLFAQYTEVWTTVDVDLSPREFVNVPTNQIADQLMATAVWPVVTQFVDQVGGRERTTLQLSTFGTVFAVLKTDDCERPATERFPLDLEVWDYWASVRSTCLS